MVHDETFNPLAFTLTSPGGMDVRVLSYGGTIAALRAPDRHGRLDDLVLGFAAPERYGGPHPYFGAVVGRYANRIGGASFAIGDTAYALSANDGAHHLHGGVRGFDKHEWQARRTDNGVVLVTRKMLNAL